MKVGGTIPDELYEWGEERISERRFFKWSHLIEVAIQKLKQEDDGEFRMADNPKNKKPHTGGKADSAGNDGGRP